MTVDHPWGAKGSGRPSRKALQRQEAEARAARRREGGQGRPVTVEVARLGVPGARAEAGTAARRPSRWASVEQAWRDEMRRLDDQDGEKR